MREEDSYSKKGQFSSEGEGSTGNNGIDFSECVHADGSRQPESDGNLPSVGDVPGRNSADAAKDETSEAIEDMAKEGKRSRVKGILYETLLMLAVAFAVAIFIQSFIIKAFMIPSSSMVPTLQIGDRIMVEKVTFYFRSPRRGDIIVFRYPPSDPQAMNTKNKLYWPFEQMGETLKLTHRGTNVFVKRVVATGGETIELRKGILYINGRPKSEDGVIRDASDFGPVRVPEGMFFCMGDNRPNSRDSRVWGMVPKRSVIGRVFLIWWPPSRWAFPK